MYGHTRKLLFFITTCLLVFINLPVNAAPCGVNFIGGNAGAITSESGYTLKAGHTIVWGSGLQDITNEYNCLNGVVYYRLGSLNNGSFTSVSWIHVVTECASNAWLKTSNGHCESCEESETVATGWVRTVGNTTCIGNCTAKCAGSKCIIQFDNQSTHLHDMNTVQGGDFVQTGTLCSNIVQPTEYPSQPENCSQSSPNVISCVTRESTGAVHCVCSDSCPAGFTASTNATGDPVCVAPDQTLDQQSDNNAVSPIIDPATGLPKTDSNGDPITQSQNPNRDGDAFDNQHDLHPDTFNNAPSEFLDDKDAQEHRNDFRAALNCSESISCNTLNPVDCAAARQQHADHCSLSADAGTLAGTWTNDDGCGGFFCDASPVQCSQLKESYTKRCDGALDTSFDNSNFEADTYASAGAGVGIAHSNQVLPNTFELFASGALTDSTTTTTDSGTLLSDITGYTMSAAPSCITPTDVALTFGTITFSWQPICDLMAYVRYVVMLVFFISGFRIFLRIAF